MESLNFKPKDFVHLHLHTDYSLLQSTIQLKPLAARLAELDMKACAITDYANLFGAVSFYNVMRSNGIRPVIGYEAMLTFGSRFDKTPTVSAGERPYYNLVLLAKDFEGYRNLVYLASKGYTEGFHYKPRLDVEILAEHSKGLIALSAGTEGAIGHFLSRGEDQRAADNAGKFADIFGPNSFYFEISEGSGKELVRKTIELGRSMQVPMVATNDAHYLVEEDVRARRVLVCIGEGRTLGSNEDGSECRHVRSAEEMWKLFGNEAPDALQNTLRIAEVCDVEIPMGESNLTLPNFPVPSDSDCTNVDEYFDKVLASGFEHRRETVWSGKQAQGNLKYDLDVYQQRLATESEVIKKMGFPGYFLIVWDFIKYAKEKGIPVGPGRGSAAGSLAAYCMQITDVDPLQYDLLFERFLNPERISMPDIDIDFCIRGRGDVIEHVTQVYGRDSVCQIITFGTMASRAAIKDVGRALNMPYGDVEKIAKLIPPPVRGRNVSISQALQQVPEFKKAVEIDPKVKDLVSLALKIEGCARHTSVHAAGVVISPKPLHELVPVAVSSKNELTSQYTMNDLEKVGMLKMDFLALTTLTVISDALRSLKERTGEEIDWSQIPLNDEKTMAIFAEGRTEAIFQFESSGMQEICRRLKPKELEDLSALNALYRPGPIDGGMIEDFILRHRGEKQVRYLVPQMKEILSNTYGVLVYQEQIMQLAQKLAGYSLGEADMMRRAMGKKKREEMAKHEEKFISGAVANGIRKEHAAEIFTLMSQFADYGFNRSHSIAYAYLAFQTAYLKAHYPSYFYAAVLSHESDDSAKVYKYSSELKSLGLRLLPPDINESEDDFTPLSDSVRFGLNAIRGIGAATVGAIKAARRTGPFSSVSDFMGRLESNSINRRGFESLAASGAFDSLNHDGEEINKWRAKLYAGIDLILAHGQRLWEDKQRGQNALFGSPGEGSDLSVELPDCLPWTQADLSRQEKSSLGFYLSVHPLDEYTKIVGNMNVQDIETCSNASTGETMRAAGIISGMHVRYSKKGNRFCIFRLEDRSGGVKCIAWGDTFSKHSDVLSDDRLVIVCGKIEASEGQDTTLIVSEVQPLDDAMFASARELRLAIPASIITTAYIDELFGMFSRNPGTCDVYISMVVDGVQLKLHSQPLKVRGSRLLETSLSSKGCAVNWTI